MRRILSANSKRAFLIPARRSQNMRGRIQGCRRFHASRYKTRSGGHRFLGADFSILVSQFKFPVRTGKWETPRFSFLVSHYKPRDGKGQDITHFSFLVSNFPILASKGDLAHPKSIGFSVLVSRFRFHAGPPFLVSQTITFLNSCFSFLYGHTNQELCA